MEVILLSVNDLIPSKDNFYSIGNITELKESIQMFGVKQNLIIKPRNDGKYIIVSGHRRHQACLELVKEGQPEHESVPCSIEPEHDEIKEKILFITTNSTIRELSDWEKMRQAQELKKYFQILKKRDKLKGEVRDLVAEALNTSPTQIGRLNAISNNLSDDFMEEFKKERIGFCTAYELSGLSSEKQDEKFEEYEEKGSLSINDAKVVKSQESKEFDFADMSAVKKADFVIGSLHTYFPRETNQRIYDFIITTLEYYRESKNREFKSICKTVQGNEGNTCLYNTRLDTYGCGCQHDCSYCYAKSLLSFRNLWNENEPKIADIREIEKAIAKIPQGTTVRLGGMTDCFQPLEETERITLETIKLLNKYGIGYLIVTKSHLVANSEYMEVYDQNLTHIQITVTCLDDEIASQYENASPPSARIKAIERLQDAGFDVSLRISPFIEEYIDFERFNALKVDKCLVEFLRVNSFIKKSFPNVDYSKYTHKHSNYEHLPLESKIRLLEKLKLNNVSVCEDVPDHYVYWAEHFNPNKYDCCNLE